MEQRAGALSGGCSFLCEMGGVVSTKSLVLYLGANLEGN